MNLQPGSTISVERSGAHSGSGIRLKGRWLLAARLTWLVIAAWALALFVISLPAYYQRHPAQRGGSGAVEGATGDGRRGNDAASLYFALAAPTSASSKSPGSMESQSYCSFKG